MIVMRIGKRLVPCPVLWFCFKTLDKVVLPCFHIVVELR